MDADLQRLARRARSGEAVAFRELLDALRARPGLPASALLELLRSDSEALRRAGIAAARGRTEPELLAAVREQADRPEVAVRVALADALADDPAWPLDHLAERLMKDADATVRGRAARAAARRPALQPLLVLRLRQESSWTTRQAVAEALGDAPARLALPWLLGALAEDSDGDVRRACAASAERLLANGWPADATRPTLAAVKNAREKLASISGPYYRLMNWLDSRISFETIADSLREYGFVLTEDAELAKLPRAVGVEDLCATVRSAITGEGPHAVVLLGEPGVGKTAVVYELAHRLHADPDPWHVLRVTPTEFLTNTKYTGEWETKVSKLVEAIRAPKRVLLYVPNLSELSMIGTWSRSDVSVASALAPHIERGSIAVLGESTSEMFRGGLGSNAALRRLFQPVEVEARTPAETRAVLRAICDAEERDVPDALLDRLMDLADAYLPGTAQPGRAVSLLRRLLDGPDPLTPRAALETLSDSTGVPVDLLDDEVPLEAAKVRAFFEARVMGQPEAVEAVTDLVLLVKAGLADPNKPFGVLLFVGPTGVGKTELARALAELLFGDPGRLTRLDMSEFATYDAHERLIGQGTRPGLLTTPVRERPFSVVLLDEVEKAHVNVFDLCLQVFDAGRLTDTQGKTTDFRRTIVVLTSNVGATVAAKSPIGFGRSADAADTTFRELGRVFRPEFLNRLDRVVTFRPLSEETAASIARREVARVLERSGITRRHLAVDVDPGVVQLLLREGYSPAFGARPLKRTVERLVLMPVARAIAEGAVPAGAVLRLTARDGRVRVGVTRPETGESDERPPERKPATPVAERAAALAGEVAKLRDAASPLAARKSACVARSAEPNFWDDHAAARAVLDEIYRLDGVFAALDAAGSAARDLGELAGQRHARGPAGRGLERRLDALGARVRHVGFLVGCSEPRQLADAFVLLTGVSAQGARLDGVGRLARMYQGLARRWGLEPEVLGDRQGGDPPEDAVLLQVNGPGAAALLAGEAGLHQLSWGRGEGAGEKKRPANREVVRVEVLPWPVGEAALPREEVRAEVRPLTSAAGRLIARPKLDVQLLHTPSLATVRAWTDRPRAEAVEKLLPLLQAAVAAAGRPADGDGRPVVVRRYRLGPSPLVKDLRSGRSLGRLDQVLAGDLDLFLSGPAGADSRHEA
jgi:ATP-dependent Clp protease ATP-binding subunit ClpC